MKSFRDISVNPRSAVKFPCGTCIKEFTDCICCDDCNIWFHRSFLDMFLATFDHYCIDRRLTWICPCHFPSLVNNGFMSYRYSDKYIYNSLELDYVSDDSDTTMISECFLNAVPMLPQ